MTIKAKVRRIGVPAALPGPRDYIWNRAEAISIDQFRPEGTSHRPQTSLKLLHDNRAIYGLFCVQDQYVRCTHETYGDPVYEDSCVEFFVRPKSGCGYFNFEFNCGGAFLCHYITDETRLPGGFKECTRLSEDEVKSVRVASSLPKIVNPEIAGPVTWWLAFALPVQVVEKFTGPMSTLSSQVWGANVFKCGDETSHPHWASWSPVDQLNFHLPRCFGELAFE